MDPRNPLDNAVSRLASVIVTPEDVEIARRVRHGLDPQGRPNMAGQDFIPILSTPGKKLMRLRVADNGTVYATEES